MQVLTGNDIAKEIKKIEPHTIIVAYIGFDWDTYINSSKIKRIVIAPTLGSNPYGIEKLKNALMGWEKIGFLDNLHAKIYIGNNAVVIGSPNLSKNALGEGGLEECAVITQDKDIIKSCHEFSDKIWRQSSSTYPTANEKERKIEDLKKLKSSVSTTIANYAPSFSEYQYKNNPVYPVWWTDQEDPNWNKETISERGLDEDMLDGMDFAEDDIVGEDTKWLLCYRVKGSKNKNISSISWQYADQFVENASEEIDYPNTLISIDGNVTPTPPFKIDKKFKNSFKRIILRSRYKKLLPNDDDSVWKLKDCEKLLPSFFAEIKKDMKNST